MPSSVVTLTTTASRLMAVPIPSATRFCAGIGNETGNAVTPTTFISGRSSFPVDPVLRRLAREHEQHFFRGRDAHAGARLDGHAGEMGREDGVVEAQQRVAGLEAIVLVDVEHGARDLS